MNIFFPAAMWLSSRFAIAVAMLLIAPLLAAPPNGVAATFSSHAFSAWDSGWYEKIATFGYDYANDGKEHSIAFFPLFPLVIRTLMTLGLPFEVAGILVNNLAFLAALIILYFWVEERYDKSAARWVTSVLAWFPYSLYGTVIYTEGLFLLCSTAALRAFDRHQHIWAAFWGALATATRLIGIMLIPAFLLVAWKQSRGIKAYLASLATGGGLFVFSLYCQITFGDALAFIHVQKGWRSSYGFASEGWWKMLMQILLGQTNWKGGYIKDPWHPLLLLIIVVGSYLLWRFRLQLGCVKVRFGFYLLWFLLWLVAGESLIKIVFIFGGVYLLWSLKNQIPLVAVIYGFCSFGLILNTGLTASVERYAYGIVSLSYAFGLLLARFQRWGYGIMGWFAIVLVSFAVRFAQKLWVS
ncbi:MAG: hypothetical protein DSM106950_34110 [Stigonema ocellatum SAG 48.90 = DSM 106950]|nr:hypothetical protein [Stigonema ocellatum SAG 48.90 = DSM 106950]